jgi:hypothetical protein
MIGVIIWERSNLLGKQGMISCTWMKHGWNKNHCTDYMWFSNDGSDASKKTSAKGKCLIVVHAGTWSEGLIDGCDLVFLAKSKDVSFKKYMPPPLAYFKVNICHFPLPHFASIFFAYLWSFRWPNYIVTLPRYFSFRLPHLNIPTGPPSDELDKNVQRTSHGILFSHWNGYSHFRSGLNWSRE